MTKPRVQVDAFLIGAFMVIFGMLALIFPGMYLEGKGVQSVFAVVGFALIIIGALLRMAGRGFKKTSSERGNRLVTGGPYKLVRNPMYLGTFLIGLGFMFPLYPLWMIAIFSAAFYLRFIIQIRKEEAWLKNAFGTEYEDYCRRTPVFVPTLLSMKSLSLRELFPWDCLWTTTERSGLFYWPLLSVVLQLLEGLFLRGSINLTPLMADGVILMLLLFWMGWCIAREKRQAPWRRDPPPI